jgi:urease accessory protein
MLSLMIRRLFCLSILMLVFADCTFAHQQTGVAGGFISGFSHPLLGLDHLVAMVAVGLWGAQLGRPAIWTLPITFPMVMALGGMLGIMALPIPFAEIAIAVSAIILGLMVASQSRAPLPLAALLVGVFAIFHGHAHGAELPTSANPMAYAVGFVIATGLLHLGGILVGLIVRWPAGIVAVRACGGVISLVGLFFLTQYGNLF